MREDISQKNLISPEIVYQEVSEGKVKIFCTSVSEGKVKIFGTGSDNFTNLRSDKF